VVYSTQDHTTQISIHPIAHFYCSSSCGEPSSSHYHTTQKDQAVVDSLAKWGALIPKARQTALVAGQFSKEEWVRYRLTPAAIWKFLNDTPASGISAVFKGVTYCAPDTMMADTGADTMLLTKEFCNFMGLTIRPTSLQIHTSVAGIGGLLREVAQPFHQALGTKYELRVPVGPGTLIPIVGVAESNPIYQVLLCQTFHHIVVRMVNPLMGRLTYMPHFWSDNDTSVVGTLEGMPGPDRETIYTAHITHALRPTTGPIQTARQRQQDLATALAALQHLKGTARHVVRTWCNQQPQDAMCNIDTVFDLLLAN
jgi:hypothetical protein